MNDLEQETNGTLLSADRFTISVITAVLDNDNHLCEYDRTHLQPNYENDELMDSDDYEDDPYVHVHGIC